MLALNVIEYDVEGSGIMFVLRLQRLRPWEAEEAIGEIWQVLEAHNIDTPAVRAMGQDRITIELSFKSKEDTECVAAALQTAGAKRAVAS